MHKPEDFSKTNASSERHSSIIEVIACELVDWKINKKKNKFGFYDFWTRDSGTQ